MLTGGIKLTNFDNLKSNVDAQKAASAWSGVDWATLTGAGYKPLLYVGEQVVNGINHCFIAEQTLMTRNVERHIVTLKINENRGEYKIVKDSIQVIY